MWLHHDKDINLLVCAYIRSRRRKLKHTRLRHVSFAFFFLSRSFVNDSLRVRIAVV